VQQIEAADAANPSLRVIFKIARALQVDIIDVFGRG
jgi:DNA-binding XRE family transcriptional regulator